jgi:EAL domain-containing protein (putative c-di-GMP-specific phosphodiesterase class I)
MTGVKSAHQPQRDRYVAFAFAAADLLLEVQADRRITFASGATQSMLGRTTAEMLNVGFSTFIAAADRAVALRLLLRLQRLKQGGRLEPITIRLLHRSGDEVRAMLGGCSLPSGTGELFVTLTLVGSGDGDAKQEPAARDGATGLLESVDLFERVRHLSALAGGRTRDLVLVRVNGLSAATKALPPDRAKSLMQEIGASLRAVSAGGDTAGRVGAEEFCIVTSGNALGSEDIAQEIDDLARAAGVDKGALTTSSRPFLSNPSELDDAEIDRAIAYAIRQFTDGAGTFGMSQMERGLPSAVDAAVHSFADLRSSIRGNRFKLVFQPIVSLNNRNIHHFEALLRFEDGRKTFESIKFAESVGLIEELDLAIIRRALAEIGRTPGGHSIAVNLSGRSVEGDVFRRELLALLGGFGAGDRRRMLFELTESSGVQSVEEVARFLSDLKRGGHAICLDDFGSGATAYAYLRHFDVDFVKVDGPFLRAAIEKPREQALIRSVCRLCRDLNCGVVGEMIEEERQADAAARLGVDFGQGWLFGKPVGTLPAAAPAGRARRTSW